MKHANRFAKRRLPKLDATIEGVPPERFQEIIAFLKSKDEFKCLCEMLNDELVKFEVTERGLEMSPCGPLVNFGQTYVFFYNNEAISVQVKDSQLYIVVEKKRKVTQ